MTRFPVLLTFLCRKSVLLFRLGLLQRRLVELRDTGNVRLVTHGECLQPNFTQTNALVFTCGKEKSWSSQAYIPSKDSEFDERKNNHTPPTVQSTDLSFSVECSWSHLLVLTQNGVVRGTGSNLIGWFQLDIEQSSCTHATIAGLSHSFQPVHVHVAKPDTSQCHHCSGKKGNFHLKQLCRWALIHAAKLDQHRRLALRKCSLTVIVFRFGRQSFEEQVDLSLHGEFQLSFFQRGNGNESSVRTPNDVADGLIWIAIGKGRARTAETWSCVAMLVDATTYTCSSSSLDLVGHTHSVRVASTAWNALVCQWLRDRQSDGMWQWSFTCLAVRACTRP